MGDARLEQARTLSAAGQFKDAMGVLKGLLQAEPQNAEARRFLTEVQDNMMLDLQISQTLAKAEDFAAQGQGDQAQKLLRDVLKVSPGQLKAKAMLESMMRPPAAGESRPNPEAGLPMDAFELEPPPGEVPGGEPSVSQHLQAREPAFTLDSLDGLGDPFAEPVVQATVLSWVHVHPGTRGDREGPAVSPRKGTTFLPGAGTKMQSTCGPAFYLG